MWSHHFMTNRWGNNENSERLFFTADGDWSHEIKRCLLLGRKAMTKLDSILKSRDITLPTKVFSHVWMWELDYKESWALKNWCCWTVMLEKTLERPLYCKEIQPVNPKGNQSWIFIERTEAEAPILWPPDAKSQLIGKDPDAGKDWRQEKKVMTEDKMVGWHHRLNGHEFEKTPEMVKDREGWCAAVHRVTKNQTGLSDWTITMIVSFLSPPDQVVCFP